MDISVTKILIENLKEFPGELVDTFHDIMNSYNYYSSIQGQSQVIKLSALRLNLTVGLTTYLSNENTH